MNTHTFKPSLSNSTALGSLIEKQALTAQTVYDRDLILQLEPEWKALEAENSDCLFFQSFNWCANFLDFCSDDESIEPLVITIRQGKKLIALMPLAIHKGGITNVLTGLTEPYQQYTDILIAEEIEVSLVKDLLIEEIKKTGADYLHSGQVRADSNLARVLKSNAKRVGDIDRAPFVSLTKWVNFDEYFKSVKPKTRKNMRNARNRLKKTAQISHKCSDDPAFLCEVIDRAFEGREAWLERLGMTSRAFRKTEFKLFLDRFKSREKTDVEIIAMTLNHGDTPMSDQWGFVYQGRYYAYMATWNETYEASSPGKLHLSEVIEACYDRNIKVADFMIPGSAYKYTWTEHGMPVHDYVYPMSFKGFLRCTIWLRFLRPVSKRIFALAPAGIRKFLLNTILR